MKLLTKAITEALVLNDARRYDEDYDPKPVVKFFNPCGAATWLITEMDPETRNMFGLCDLGFGCPELGSVSFDELAAIKVAFGLGIERDMHFKADKTLSEYANEARMAGAIAA